VVSAVGPLLAGVAVFSLIQKAENRESKSIKFSLATLFPVAAWRKVLANRAAAGFTLGYTAHCIELFGSRGWMVAFLAYSGGQQSAAGWIWAYVAIGAGCLAAPLVARLWRKPLS